jgi:hypothetical protein
MRFVINAMGLAAWAFSALVFFFGVAELGKHEPGTVDSMIENASFDAALPTIGFGLGCFLVGALIKRKS